MFPSLAGMVMANEIIRVLLPTTDAVGEIENLFKDSESFHPGE